MKELKKLFTVSFKNLKCHKWLNARIVVTLSVFMFLISLFSVFYASTGIMYESYPAERVSTNYIFSREVITDLPAGTQVTEIKTGEYSSRLISILGENHKGQMSSYNLASTRVRLELEGKEYIYHRGNVFSYTNSYTSGFNVYSWDENFFTENDYSELELRFGLDCIVIGETPKASDEILLSAEMLKWYGLQPDDVLGKQVSFNYSFNPVIGGEIIDYGPIWERQFTVTGVIREEYYQLYGHSPLDPPLWIGWFSFPSVFMMPDAEAFNEIENYGAIFYMYSFNDWHRDRGYESREDYCGCGVLWVRNRIDRIRNIMSTLFLVLGICLGGGMLLTIYLLTDKFMRHFARNGGTLLAEGLSERQLKISVLVQILFLCLIAMFISFALTAFVYWGLSAAAVKFAKPLARVNLFNLNEIFAFNSAFFIILTLVELAVVAVVALCLMLNVLLFTRKKSIKELLNTSTD